MRHYTLDPGPTPPPSHYALLDCRTLHIYRYQHRSELEAAHVALATGGGVYQPLRRNSTGIWSPFSFTPKNDPSDPPDPPDAQYQELILALQDPAAVHANMLRGTIAWTPENLRHLLGDTADP